MKFWLRITSTLAYVIGLTFIAVPVHEFFHYLTLRLLGGDGYVTYSLQRGWTEITVAPDHEWIVALAGGVLTGVFLLGVFWFWAWKSKTVNDTNLEVAAFIVALSHLAYAPTELIFDPVWGPLALVAGSMVAVIVYFTKLSNWIAPTPKGLGD